MSARSLLDLWALSSADLRAILDEAARRKRARAGLPKGAADGDRPLDGRLLAMIFEKKSTRTRASFEVAMRQLGGASAVYNASDLQLGRGETIEDTARVLSGFFDAAMLRTNSHATVEAFAAASAMPVINGLTDQSHPCQILADLLTFEELVGPLAGSRWAWLGDGNNVLASLLHAAPRLDFDVAVATPAAYRPKPQDLARAEGRAEVFATAAPAVAGADVIITDTWISMGDADEDQRRAAFPPFQVTQALMAKAAPRAIFLHCLPAHRGEEVEASVIDGPRSLVFAAAENRLHAQKAALMWCFGLL